MLILQIVMAILIAWFIIRFGLPIVKWALIIGLSILIVRACV